MIAWQIWPASPITLSPIPQVRFLVFPVPPGIVVDALDFSVSHFALYLCGYSHNQTARRNDRSFCDDRTGGHDRL